MKNSKRKQVPMCSAEDFFSGKKDAKPVGRMSNSDDLGPVLVDLETLLQLAAKTPRGKGDSRRK